MLNATDDEKSDKNENARIVRIVANVVNVELSEMSSKSSMPDDFVAAIAAIAAVAEQQFAAHPLHARRRWLRNVAKVENAAVATGCNLQQRWGHMAGSS
ncbi:MAG: hypothetical protein JNM70_24335 [Anaerolineae bacterium]|nr:hypothetical protein [Anaerolineae bacterium]